MIYQLTALRLSFLILVAFSFLVSVPATHALTVRPTTIEVSVSPGGSSEGVFFLKNDEDIEQTYFFSLQKFIPAGEHGQQEFLPPSETSGLPSWIFLPGPAIKIPAGATRPVSFTVRPPINAEAGGHYAAIFVSSQAPNEGANGIRVSSRLGILVLATVKGEVRQALRLESWERTFPVSISHFPVAFTALVKNEGNVHAVPSGAMAIIDMFGRRLAHIPLNEDGGRVLPDSSRRFSVAWGRERERSGSGFWHEAKEEWSNFGFGKYQARLETDGVAWISWSASAPIRITFYVWPWRVMSLIIIAMVLIWIVLRQWRRRAL